MKSFKEWDEKEIARIKLKTTEKYGLITVRPARIYSGGKWEMDYLVNLQVFSENGSSFGFKHIANCSKLRLAWFAARGKAKDLVTKDELAFVKIVHCYTFDSDKKDEVVAFCVPSGWMSNDWEDHHAFTNAH